ncbi:MAG: AI-2E family transporter [Solirubrobacterales bacterium]|nr:AI-2E family transporter [Solirubrobacterales bacterium]
MNGQVPAARAVVRTVMIVVSVLVVLYLIYLLRKPIGWLLVATFLAVALSGPVNLLHRRMKRGLAIAIVYLGLLMIPIGIGVMIVPPIVTGAEDLARNAPEYADDVTRFVNESERLQQINDDYDITGKLQEEAAKLPEKLGDAASVLRDVGLGIVNSVFAVITILILTAFMLGGGRRWIMLWLRFVPEERAERLERVFDRSARAVGNYVAGALAQAALAGVTSYIVLTILGVPFAAPLALIVFFLDLIPMVGATIGAIIVGLVTLFTDFPTATIIWIVWSIVYQQVENNLVQPQIQKRAVDINPFLVIVSVLFGGTLLGVIGALMAVPVAATIQIAVREWADSQGIRARDAEPAEPPEPPPADPPGAPPPEPPAAPA